MFRRIKEFSDRLKAKNESLWQLIAFFLLGAVAMVVDLASFALCNYVIFTGYRDIPFHWWLLDYSAANGGLCAFLSFAVSFALSQTVNFFVQRKATFDANNNPVFSGIAYAVMVLGTYAFVLWLPTVVGEYVYSLFGAGLGATVLKLLSEFLAALIQFPINKWVIMRKKSG